MESANDEATFQVSVVSRVAGEDLKPGDFVTVLTEILELPSFLWCCDHATSAREEPVRMRYLPRQSGEPFKVIAVCLPFVYTKGAHGKLATFDTRKHQLVKLAKATGRKIRKRMRSNV
jgi:hypothetical protein